MNGRSIATFPYFPYDTVNYRVIGKPEKTMETVKCPHCFSDIDKRAAVCPVCRRDVKPVTKARSGGGIIRWLAALSLVALCCGGAAVVGLPMLAALGNVGSTAATSEAVEANITREPAPLLIDVLLNYRRMTDAQWNAYAETLVGKRAVDWTGTITEVDEGEIVGDFTVIVKGTGAAFLEDIYIDVPEETAMRLSKDQRIVFSGDITSASNAMGLTLRLNNAEIKTR